MGRKEWELVANRLDENTIALKEAIQKSREHYHLLVNTLISQTVQTVATALKHKQEKESA